MSNIGNYSANAGKPVQYVKTNDTTKNNTALRYLQCSTATL